MARRVSFRKVKEFVKQQVAADLATGVPKGQIRKRAITAAKEEFGALDPATLLVLVKLILAILEAFKK